MGHCIDEYCISNVRMMLWWRTTFLTKSHTLFCGIYRDIQNKTFFLKSNSFTYCFWLCTVFQSNFFQFLKPLLVWKSRHLVLISNWSVVTLYYGSTFNVVLFDAGCDSFEDDKELHFLVIDVVTVDVLKMLWIIYHLRNVKFQNLS